MVLPANMTFDPMKLLMSHSPADQRYSFVVAGPGGTGKSTLLGSMADVVGADRCLLLATLLREKNSWLYKEKGIKHLLFSDPNWLPSSDPPKYEAEGMKKLLMTIDWLHDKDEQFDAIMFDSGTEAGELGWHASLMPYSVASPAQITDNRSRWLPYEQLDSYLDQLVKGLVALTTTAKRPKHVGISWHVQPQKDDAEVKDGAAKKIVESADHKAEGIEYEGTVLPSIRGKFRRKVITLVDAFLFSDINFRVPEQTGFSTQNNGNLIVEYRVQVRPDQDRHTKLPGPLPDVKYIPNDFKELLKLFAKQTAAKGSFSTVGSK
jgi:hypothetical protein